MKIISSRYHWKTKTNVFTVTVTLRRNWVCKELISKIRYENCPGLLPADVGLIWRCWGCLLQSQMSKREMKTHPSRFHCVAVAWSGFVVTCVCVFSLSHTHTSLFYVSNVWFCPPFCGSVSLPQSHTFLFPSTYQSHINTHKHTEWMINMLISLWGYYLPLRTPRPIRFLRTWLMTCCSYNSCHY